MFSNTKMQPMAKQNQISVDSYQCLNKLIGHKKSPVAKKYGQLPFAIIVKCKVLLQQLIYIYMVADKGNYNLCALGSPVGYTYHS